MTKTMKAVAMTAPGGVEVLELRSLPLDWPRGERDVLVRLRAAALNPADAYFREFGPYLESPGPCVLGHDGAGTVEAAGPGVSCVQPGDRVCFCNGGIGGEPGTYAEFAVVPEDQLVAVPDGVDFERAAALPLVTITAWESLYDRAGVKAGEFALIHGGAGGTGHVAVQLANLKGARVAATVSSEAKADFVRRLGAERAIDYRHEDFVAAARDWAEGRGLDVALDNVGPEVMRATFRAMAPYGRVVTLIGLPGDDEDETAYVGNLTIHNVMMLTPMVHGMTDRLRGQAAIVAEGMKLLAAGRLQIHVAATYPLSEAAQAQAHLDAGGMTGKIVLSIPN